MFPDFKFGKKKALLSDQESVSGENIRHIPTWVLELNVHTLKEGHISYGSKGVYALEKERLGG